MYDQFYQILGIFVQQNKRKKGSHFAKFSLVVKLSDCSNKSSHYKNRLYIVSTERR